MNWITCTKNHIKSVYSFLEAEEPYSISCITRIKRETIHNNFAAGSLCMALINEIKNDACSDIFSGTNMHICGILYYSTAHMLYPVFSHDMVNKLGDTSNRLLREIQNFSNSIEGVIGKSSDVHTLDRYIPQARVILAYDFMIHTDSGIQETGMSLDNEVQLEVRRATIDDLQELTAIEAAYQKEEVLTPIHEFNLALCRANQQYALLHVPVYVALYQHKIIARAQINGIGSKYEQIGGVFVKSDFRRMHAGSAVMVALMNDIRSRGKVPCLYVKKTNIPAIQLYKKLGFSTLDRFSIVYQ